MEENYNNFILSQKHYHKVHEVRSVKLSDKIIVNISLFEVFFNDTSLVITDESTIEFDLTPNVSKELLIKVSIN